MFMVYRFFWLHLNFKNIYGYHFENKAILTIGIHKLEYKLPLGYLEIDNKNSITDYIEKPVKTYNMSMGIYVCDPVVMDYIPENEYLDFPDLTKRLIKANKKVIGYHNDAYWYDIGRPEEYEKAMELFTDEDR